MSIRDRVQGLFPDEGTIPNEYMLQTAHKQDVYLVDGELRHWDGPKQKVLSPVCINTTSGLQ